MLTKAAEDLVEIELVRCTTSTFLSCLFDAESFLAVSEMQTFRPMQVELPVKWYHMCLH